MANKKEVVEPYFIRQPTEENAQFLAGQMVRTAWILWQNDKNDRVLSEMGFELLWSVAERGILCEGRYAGPFKSREDLREKFEKWVKKSTN